MSIRLLPVHVVVVGFIFVVVGCFLFGRTDEELIMVSESKQSKLTKVLLLMLLLLLYHKGKVDVVDGFESYQILNGCSMITSQIAWSRGLVNCMNSTPIGMLDLE